MQKLTRFICWVLAPLGRLLQRVVQNHLNKIDKTQYVPPGELDGSFEPQRYKAFCQIPDEPIL